MKKTMVFLLALTLCFTLASPCFAESGPGPKLETGVIQADGIPAILWLLSEGDQVTVTEALDEKTSLVETEYGTGTLETQLLRFEGDPEYEPWMGYVGYNTELYPTYELCGTPVQTLKTNTKVFVLDELEDCYAVALEDPNAPREETEQAAEGEEDQTVFFAMKKQVSKGPFQYGSGDDSGSSGAPGPQDGGDISMAYYTLSPLSDVVFEEEEKTGPAVVRVDDAKLILGTFQRGDTVQIVTEEGFAPELEGYLTILIDDTYAYVPEGWVQREGDEPFEQWNGYAGFDCKLYDNYLLRGQPIKQIYANSKLTVLWDNGEISLIQLIDKNETIGFVASSTLQTTPVSIGGDDDSSSSSGPVWTPPVL